MPAPRRDAARPQAEPAARRRNDLTTSRQGAAVVAGVGVIVAALGHVVMGVAIIAVAAVVFALGMLGPRPSAPPAPAGRAGSAAKRARPAPRTAPRARGRRPR